MKYQTNLKFWVDKLKSGEKFSMARWGDGELYCMWGKKGGNSNGCRYSPELREALVKAMEPREGFYHGLQRVLPVDEKKILEQYPNVDWYETECLSEAVAEGKLYPLIEQLKKMRCHFIANETISPFLDEHFAFNLHTIFPKSNAYDSQLNIVPVDGTVYLFSCGMAANAWISQLHGKADCWLIDVGHIWDPFTGLMSRCDLEGKTLQDINRNLKPCE